MKQLDKYICTELAFYTVPTKHCACYNAGRKCKYANYAIFVNYALFVNYAHYLSVRTSFTKCMIMYYEQTSRPSSANFCTHLHLDKVPSPANFHQNRQRPWLSFQGQRFRIEYDGKRIMHSSLRPIGTTAADTYGADGRYQSPRFEGCQDLKLTTFRQDMSRGVSL